MNRFDEYQKRAYVMLGEHEDPKDRSNNWCLGLSGEVGEVEELLKHHYYGGEVLNKEKLAKEIGDVLWYLNAIASHQGINLEACAELNALKLEHRHGGTEFSMEGSKDRHAKEVAFKDTDEYKNVIARLYNSPVEEEVRNGGYRNG